MPRILVIDDEELIRELVSTGLRRNGYDVLVASTGTEAIELVERHPDIDLALIDLTLPVVDAERTHTAIRERAPAIRTIMTGGDGKGQLARGAVSRGEAGYLRKPYTIGKLLERVHRALDA